MNSITSCNQTVFDFNCSLIEFDFTLYQSSALLCVHFRVHFISGKCSRCPHVRLVNVCVCALHCLTCNSSELVVSQTGHTGLESIDKWLLCKANLFLFFMFQDDFEMISPPSNSTVKGWKPLLVTCHTFKKAGVCVLCSNAKVFSSITTLVLISIWVFSNRN